MQTCNVVTVSYIPKVSCCYTHEMFKVVVVVVVVVVKVLCWSVVVLNAYPNALDEPV